MPEQIATISFQNKREPYGILFRAAAETLRTIAADPKHLGVEIGFFAVLGALTCSIIPICIVWSPAVVSLRMARSGFPAELDFSCRSESSPGYFVVYSWNI